MSYDVNYRIVGETGEPVWGIPCSNPQGENGLKFKFHYDGRVHIEGKVRSTSSSLNCAFIVPEEYRPVSMAVIPGTYDGNPVNLNIYPNGQVEFNGYGCDVTPGNSFFVGPVQTGVMLDWKGDNAGNAYFFDKNPAIAASWNDIDFSAYISPGAKAVLAFIYHNSASGYNDERIEIRKKGDTVAGSARRVHFEQYPNSSIHGFVAMFPLDENGKAQILYSEARRIRVSEPMWIFT